MKSRAYSLHTILSVLTISAILYGCGSSRPTNFFLMDTLPAPEAGAPDRAQNLTIGVGPVILPEYLDRRQIVIRAEGTSMKLADFDHWAEPLKDSLLRILAVNLSALLSTDRIETFPMKGLGHPDYRVFVEIQRFEGDTGGKVTLQARWVVTDEKEKESSMIRQSIISKTVETEDDFEALVAAMNEAYGDLCREIASAILKSATAIIMTNEQSK